MKCANLENRSTTVKMTLLPWTLGKCSMKSIEMSDHTWVGTSSGCSKPAGCRASVLFRWHVVQDRTKLRTTVLSVSMTKSLRSCCNVFCVPSWAQVWDIRSTAGRLAEFGGTYTRLPLRIRPCSECKGDPRIAVTLSWRCCNSELSLISLLSSANNAWINMYWSTHIDTIILSVPFGNNTIQPAVHRASIFDLKHDPTSKNMSQSEK